MSKVKKVKKEDLTLSTAIMTLKDQGITSVYILFDGSGDSGDVEVPTFSTGEEYIPTNNIENGEEVSQIIRDFVQDKLLDEVGDWWNDDGGWGEVSIDVLTGEYSTEAHIRTTSSTDDEYSGIVSDYFKDQD